MFSDTITNMIYGVAGTNASGKDSLAEYLRDEHGFLFFHTSDYIRKEAQKRYGSVLRPILFKVGNELRQEGGAGVLVQMRLNEFKKLGAQNAVISSIRTIGEVEVLHKAGGKLIFLDAPRKVRYQRLIQRKREDDQIDYDSFVEQEEAELHQSDNPAEFNILGVKKMADMFIENTEAVDDFYNSIDKVLSLPSRS